MGGRHIGCEAASHLLCPACGDLQNWAIPQRHLLEAWVAAIHNYRDGLLVGSMSAAYIIAATAGVFVTVTWASGP